MAQIKPNFKVTDKFGVSQILTGCYISNDCNFLIHFHNFSLRLHYIKYYTYLSVDELRGCADRFR